MTLNLSPSLRAARDNIRRWRHDPIAFVREQFQAEPDEWQREFLIAYGRGDLRVFAKACKGPGKTSVLSWCCWHFLVTRPYCKIPCTSITAENLRNNLWAEMAKWQQKSEFLKAAFRWTATRIFSTDHPENWFMVALAWPRDANPEQQANTLAGYHADNIMFVLDEMGGIPDSVMAAAEATLANARTEVNPNAHAQIIGAGNPTHLTGPLYRACTTEASLCTVITITGDPDSPRRSKRISAEWARTQTKKYGADNPYVLVNVFGEFPPTSINALLGPDMVDAAMRRVMPIELWQFESRVLGVDCGGGGNDPSALCPRQGLVHFRPKLLRLSDPKLIAGAVAAAAKKWQPHAINVDNTGGWGSGVISYLNDWGIACNPIGFAEKSYDRAFANKRTEMIFNFSKSVREGGCLPNIPALREACCAQTYTHYRDQMLMEPKDELKEGISDTTGFDMLDGYALTHAYPLAKPDPLASHRTAPKRGEYDPVKEHYDELDRQRDNERDYNPLSYV